MKNTDTAAVQGDGATGQRSGQEGLGIKTRIAVDTLRLRMRSKGHGGYKPGFFERLHLIVRQWLHRVALCAKRQAHFERAGSTANSQAQ